jgi:hypothetical protein
MLPWHRPKDETETDMKEISDDYMRSMMQTTKTYTLLILRPGPKPRDSWDEATIWEHGRRNFALRAEGLLSIVCPVREGSDVAGIGLFNAPIEQVDALMKEDPAVKAGILVYELHPCSQLPRRRAARIGGASVKVTVDVDVDGDESRKPVSTRFDRGGAAAAAEVGTLSSIYQQPMLLP